MKQLKWILGILALAVVPMMAIMDVASAQRFSPRIEEGQTIHSSVYSTAKTVDIHGEIFGDVFCAGQTVTIDAVVHGDIICTGQDITISGRVDGDIRIAGQTVSVAAAIAKNASVAGMDFSLDADASVGQDLQAAGDTLNIKGAITRDATLRGNTVVINGPIGRNVLAQSSKVQLKDDASIAGDFNYSDSLKPDIATGAEIKGNTNKVVRQESQWRPTMFSPVIYLMILASLTLVSVFLVSLFPRYFKRTIEIIKVRPARALLVGFLLSIGVPLMIFVFAVSVVGLPLAMTLLVALLLGTALSGPIVAYYAGRLLLKKKNANPMAAVVVGSVIIVTLYFVPLAGILFVLATYWLGLGALVIDLYAHAGARTATAKPSEE